MKEYAGDNIKKAVVLAAGKGERLKPITNAIPKELIRVGKKPAIEHVLNVIRAGGIKDVLVVTGWKKHALIDFLGSGKQFGLNIYFRMQDETKGTAHATALAEDFIGNEDFVIMYGDNYITPYDTMKDIVRFHRNKKGDGTLVLHPVYDPRRWGVVKIDEDMKILSLKEKPTLRQAEQYKIKDYWLNIAGLMIINNKIFKFIKETKPGKKGEIWLTDSIELMRKNGYIFYGYEFIGKRFDIGSFESLRKADQLEMNGYINENELKKKKKS